MAHEGYVYLWRAILHTDFYTTPNTCHLAIHLMLTAAWKDHNILMGGKSVLLQRGQLHTGRLKLMKDTGLSEREVRTGLLHLTNLGFATSKPSSHGSIITICKYDSYQNMKYPTDTRNDQPPSNDRPTTVHIQVKERRELRERKELKRKDG